MAKRKRKKRAKSPTSGMTAQQYGLEQGWDFSRDLVVFIGSGWEKQAKQLRTAGQKRTLLFAMPRGRGDYPRGCVNCKTLVGFVQQLKKYRHNKAQRVSVNVDDTKFADAGTMVAEIKRIVESEFSRQLTDELWGTRWVQQALANLPQVGRTPSIDNLRGLFKGKPAIIVAPGPSLEKNQRFLKEAYGKAVIVAVNRSAKICQQLGVGPDIVMTVDPQPLEHHFDGMQWESVGANVVGLTCHPNVTWWPGVETFFAAVNGPSDQWLCDIAKEDMHAHGAGSCTTNAMTLAEVMGCSTIITVGLDLSFPKGRQYASGGGHNHLHNKDTKLVTIEGVDGKELATTSQMRRYAKWVADTAKWTPEIEWVNATEGGAKIANMQYMTLKQAIAKYCTEAVPALSMIRGASSPHKIKAKAVRKYLKGLGIDETGRTNGTTV